MTQGICSIGVLSSQANKLLLAHCSGTKVREDDSAVGAATSVNRQTRKFLALSARWSGCGHGGCRNYSPARL
jgi:hypothetical protein